MKKCYLCGLTKKKIEFYRNKTKWDGIASECILCSSKKVKAYYKKNKVRLSAYKKKLRSISKNLERERELKLLKNYGITLENYDILLESQKGVCAICFTNKPGNKKRFSVDHDHKTGKVRGLLCDKCNRGLGYFNDNFEILEKAIKYLKGV
jgi:hypothetical protein